MLRCAWRLSAKMLSVHRFAAPKASRARLSELCLIYVRLDFSSISLGCVPPLLLLFSSFSFSHTHVLDDLGIVLRICSQFQLEFLFLFHEIFQRLQLGCASFLFVVTLQPLSLLSLNRTDSSRPIFACAISYIQDEMMNFRFYSHVFVSTFKSCSFAFFAASTSLLRSSARTRS